MGFEATSFNVPIYEEKSIEPRKAFVISCEGKNTEPEYFYTIKNKLSDYIDVLIQIEIVEKNSGNEPYNVLSDLLEHTNKKQQDDSYDVTNDEFWIVIDREKNDIRKQHIIDILDSCEDNNIDIALTNPAFEFWLLLHIVDNSLYDSDKLYKNEKINGSKRFLDKEISNILCGYSKKAGKFPKNIVTMENLKKAVEQEKFFENELKKIIDNLGSNVGKLVQRIVNI